MKEIGLNIKGIREALEKTDRALRVFAKNNPFYDHDAKVKHECESAVSFYHILFWGKFHQKRQSLVHSVQPKNRWIIACANSILLSVQ